MKYIYMFLALLILSVVPLVNAESMDTTSSMKLDTMSVDNAIPTMTKEEKIPTPILISEVDTNPSSTSSFALANGKDVYLKVKVGSEETFKTEDGRTLTIKLKTLNDVSIDNINNDASSGMIKVSSTSAVVDVATGDPIEDLKVFDTYNLAFNKPVSIGAFKLTLVDSSDSIGVFMIGYIPTPDSYVVPESFFKIETGENKKITIDEDVIEINYFGLGARTTMDKATESESVLKSGEQGSLEFDESANQVHPTDSATVYFANIGYKLSGEEEFSTTEVYLNKPLTLGNFEVSFIDYSGSTGVFSVKKDSNSVFVSDKEDEVVSGELASGVYLDENNRLKAVANEKKGYAFDTDKNETSPELYADNPTCKDGCLVEGRCVDYGIRLKNGVANYCDVSGEFLEQKKNGETCQNNFECTSNTCSSNQCVDIKSQLEENNKLLNKILDWLSKLF